MPASCVISTVVHDMSLSWLPNGLCVLRMLLAVPTAWLLLQGEYALTLGVFVIAAVSDVADGYLAKKFHWQSELGKALDPLADKLLLMTTFIALAWVHLVPQWLAALVVVRDVVITGGAIAYRMLYGPLTGAAPTVISKLNTLVQVLYASGVVLVALLRSHGIDWPPQWLVDLGMICVVLTTFSSGLHYVMLYGRRAIAASRGR
jgi:cardiolipin synthase (CMP-forming)